MFTSFLTAGFESFSGFSFLRPEIPIYNRFLSYCFRFDLRFTRVVFHCLFSKVQTVLKFHATPSPICKPRIIILDKIFNVIGYWLKLYYFTSNLWRFQVYWDFTIFPISTHAFYIVHRRTDAYLSNCYVVQLLEY